MKGKDKCKILKEIRAQIAAANDIAWVTENCTHKGECRGTCPKCEAEVAALERALARRRALGKSIAVVGLSAGLIATTASCAELSTPGSSPSLDGDMVVNTSTAPSTTWALTGDIGGAPLPPETTEALDGEMVEMGEPLPVYYLTDFTLYETERMYRITQAFNLWSVIADDEGSSGTWGAPEVDDTFMLLGDNGTEEHEAYIYLVRYQDELYAVDVYDLEHFAAEITTAE